MLIHDFYERIKSSFDPLAVYIGPRAQSLQGQHAGVESLLEQYSNDYAKVKSILQDLAILFVPFHLYHPLTQLAIDSLDQKMIEDRRAGLRSDVVYYDIKNARVVPDHRVLARLVQQEQYKVRFFLNSNRETISALINHPYELFGCVSILVHPQDKRYRKIRGRDIILPLTNRSVPVI